MFLSVQVNAHTSVQTAPPPVAVSAMAYMHLFTFLKDQNTSIPHWLVRLSSACFSHCLLSGSCHRKKERRAAGATLLHNMLEQFTGIIH